MKSRDLARDYYERAARRLKALDVLHDEGGFADVVRESQEVVELALKGLLRRCDVEVPRIHDVSDVLREHADRLPGPVRRHLDALCEASHRLRRDRELAFYGSEDLTPSDFYKEADAEEARERARNVVKVVAGAFTE